MNTFPSTTDSTGATAGFRPAAKQAARTGAKRLLAASGSGLTRLLGPHAQARCGILMYHRIIEPVAGLPAATWNVSPGDLRAQLAGLIHRGYRPWPLRQVIEHRQHDEPIPHKVFVVTFDDAYESVYRHAWPILRELQVPCTLFLATCYLDATFAFPFDDWSLAGSNRVPRDTWLPITTSQCLEMADSGLVELAAHTHTHQDFTSRPRDFAVDLAANVSTLRSQLGIENPTFAFPFGLSTPALVDAVRRSGCVCALTTQPAPVELDQSLYGWGRFNVERWDTAATLAGKLSGWYSWLTGCFRRFDPIQQPSALVR